MAIATMFTETNTDVIFDGLLYGWDNIPLTIHVFISWDQEVSNLKISSFTASLTQSFPASPKYLDVRIDKLEGKERLFKVTLQCIKQTNQRRYGNMTGTLTLTLAANAVTETNSETTFTFNWYSPNWTSATPYNLVSLDTYFPNISDWEQVSTRVIPNIRNIQYRGGILYATGYNKPSPSVLLAYDPSDMTRLPSQDIPESVDTGLSRISYPNSFVFYNGRLLTNVTLSSSKGIYLTTDEKLHKNFTNILMRFDTTDNGFGRNLVLTPEGFVSGRKLCVYPNIDAISTDEGFRGMNALDIPEVRDFSISYDAAIFNSARGTSKSLIGYGIEKYWVLMRSHIALMDTSRTITPDNCLMPPRHHTFYNLLDALNIGLTFSEEFVYISSTSTVYRMPIEKLYKPQKRQQIYPIFTGENTTIDLTNYIKGAERIVFDEDWIKPSYLSLTGTNPIGKTLSIGTLPTETDEVFLTVNLRATNKRGTTEKGEIKIPFVIQKAKTTPQWIPDLRSITVSPGDTLNLHDYCSDATSFSTLETPTGTSLSGSILTAGSTAGTVRLRATQGSNTADVSFDLLIDTYDNRKEIETFQYQIKIAGIDVSKDLLKEGLPSLRESLDPVLINSYVIDGTSFSLKNPNGYYSTKATPNFWNDNNLNPNGFREEVQIAKVYRENQAEVEQVIFIGEIIETDDTFTNGVVSFNVNNTEFNLKKKSPIDKNNLPDTVGIEKYASTFRSISEAYYEGVYTLESGLVPMVPEQASVWTAGTAVTLKDIQNELEGVVVDNSAFLTANAVRTQGGYLKENPTLKYRMPYFYKKASFVVNKLARAGKMFNPDISQLQIETQDAFMQSKGNIAYNILKTRITHVIRDWVHHNGKVYILLSNPDVNYQDMLVAHDLETDTEAVLKRFDAALTTLKLAFDGTTTFYIMVTESMDLDRSQMPLPTDNLEVVSKYDRAMGAQSKILKFDASTDSVSDHVSVSHANPPQPGMHDWVGFNNPQRIYDWQGIVPDSRGSFKLHGTDLYYKWCSTTHFGVAKVSSTGTVTQLWNIAKSERLNHLKFDFDVDTNGIVWFGYAEPTLTGSTLYVKKYQNDASVDVLTDTKTYTQLTDSAPSIANQGGWYAGIHELLVDGTDIYLVVEIGRTIYYYGNSNSLKLIWDNQKGAGATLYKIDTTQAIKILENLQNYKFSQIAARSLTRHDGKVYFVESPAEIYKYPPFNPDFPGVDSLGLDLELPERNQGVDNGLLRSIDTTTGDITTHGGLWFEQQAFHGTPTQLLSIGSDLHIIMMHGNADGILQKNHVCASPGNFQWVVYGRTLQFILGTLPVHDNIFDTLTDIATKINATLQIQNNHIKINRRSPQQFQINGALTRTAVSLLYDGAVGTEFPDSGYLLIDNELIHFTGKTSTMLTGLTRGVYSEAVAHADNSAVFLLDLVINPKQYLQDVDRLDSNRLYNIVKSGDIVEKRNETSIESLGVNILSIDFGLSAHDRTWIDHIADQYLSENQDVSFLIRLSVPRQTAVQLGDLVNYNYGDIVFPIRVVSLQKHPTHIEMTGRTQTKPPMLSVGPGGNALGLGTGDYLSDGKGNYLGDGK